MRLAQVNPLDGWRFTEWFHGKTLEPMGVAGQSWNAATFLLVRQALETGVRRCSWRTGAMPGRLDNRASLT